MATQISDKFKTIGKIISHREGAYPFQNFYLEPQELVDEDLQFLDKVSITIGKGFDKPDREPWADALADKHGGFENLVGQIVNGELSPNRQQPEHNGIKQFYVKTMSIANQSSAPAPVRAATPQTKSAPSSMESGAERGNGTTNGREAIMDYWKINLDFPSDEWIDKMAERSVLAGRRIRYYNNLPEEVVNNEPVDVDDPFEFNENSPLSEGQQRQKHQWEQNEKE